jgi:molybdopterin molybdotransferase
MTGAILPRGCDAVAKWEDVEAGPEVGPEAGPAPAPAWIALTQPVTRWAFVRRQGEVFTRGEIFGPGTLRNLNGQRVTPAVAGLLAALGVRRILVTRRPRVGILATGDELVPFDACCGPGQVRSSNAPMLAGLAAAIGCETVALGSSRDSVDEIARHLTEARGLDAVLVSGGVSGGKFDLVSRALTTLGAEIGFSAIRMSPGKRVTCARLGGTICWCLPGSPGAALVGFVMIARPGLLRMMGLDDIEPAVVRARSTGPIEKTSGCTRLVPGALERRGQLQRRGILRNPSPGRGAAPRAPTEVEPLGLRGSADVVAVAQADCLIRLGEDRGPVAAGEIVDVLLL